MSLFQQFLESVGFVAVGDNNYLPEVQPSSTHVSVKRGTDAFLKLTSAQVPSRRDYETNSSKEKYWKEAIED